MSRSLLQTVAPLLLGSLLLGVRVGAAGPTAALTEDLLPERDALLVKIAAGVDYERSVARFAALLKERERRKGEADAAASRKVAEREQLLALQRTLDFLVGEHCTLATTPDSPPARPSWGMRGDWGRVITKQAHRLKPKNAFEDGEEITLYRVQGTYRVYTISSKGPSLYLGKPLVAALNDLVLVCHMSLENHGSGSPYPEGFRDNILSQGFAARIKAPPRIAAKQRWNPIHLTGGSTLRIAIDKVEWHLPENHPIVNQTRVLEDLGVVGGVHRYAMAAERQSFVLEVPPTLPRRQLLQPGKFPWIIMSKPRFDRELKKLVLVAEDIEERYVDPVD